ncbi:MAG: alanine dehydrogenase, partial [Alphaproteobacteria bacterium]|nr:alanine dehydrogenase [Alphaproteobacteria bacterium]
DPEQTAELVESGVTAIAYETVSDEDGRLPLLAPMSEVAGRMSIQAGAHCLERAQGGRGVLLGGVPGVTAADVVVLGGGVVGTNAARMAMGMEARVTVIDKSLPRLAQLDLQFGPMLNTIFATVEAVESHVLNADLVVGAVLVPGAEAPQLITADMVHGMRRGSVIVDVSIDQGGVSETSRPTTHTEPTYVVDEVVHYCVTNMPGAVARTSTFALNNATLPYVLSLAEQGWQKALGADPGFAEGLNVHAGQVTHPAVAEDLEYDYVAPETLLG